MLYRKQSGPVTIWGGLGVAVVALALGFVGGRLSAPQATLQRLLQPGALHLRQAAGALDIVRLEYARARSGNPESQLASLKALEQAQLQLSEAAPLDQLYPQDVAEARRALASAVQAVQQRQDQVLVEGRLEEVRTRLTRLAERVPR